VNFFYQTLYCADTVLQGVLLVLLLRGPFRKYTVFALYILAQFAASVSEYIAFYRVGWESSAYRMLYWTDQVTQTLLLFLVVIAFTYAALKENPLRPKAARALGLIVAVALALPFAMLHINPNRVHPFFSSQWFNHASQVWNFGAAVMNLVLWTALLSNRRRDPQLVTVSIGVGIVTASAAIAWGARRWLPEADRWTADSFMLVTHLACLLLWCWAFRIKAGDHSTGAPPPSGAKPPNNAPSNALTTPS
jgi:hypothetical protein